VRAVATITLDEVRGRARRRHRRLLGRHRGPASPGTG
jgi:hypothetical protein